MLRGTQAARLEDIVLEKYTPKWNGSCTRFPPHKIVSEKVDCPALEKFRLIRTSAYLKIGSTPRIVVCRIGVTFDEHRISQKEVDRVHYSWSFLYCG